MSAWEYKLFTKDLFGLIVSSNKARDISGENISDALEYVNQNNYINSNLSHSMNVFEGMGKCSFVSTVVFFSFDQPKLNTNKNWKHRTFRENSNTIISDSTSEPGVDLLIECLNYAKDWINRFEIDLFTISHNIEVYRNYFYSTTLASVTIFYQGNKV